VTAEPAAPSVRQRGARAAGVVVPRRIKRRRALWLRRMSAKKLGRIAKSSGPIVAGPWVGPVGMELLYWIPLLGWLTTAGGVDPARVVAVSRGGADPWYSKVAGQYVDLLDHYSPEELRRWHQERLRRPGTELHIGVHTHDHHMFGVARELAGADKAEWLHPLLMHRLFAPRWEWGASGAVIGSHTAQRPLPASGDAPPLDLPDPYVALKAYFNPSFPDTPANRAVLRKIVADVAERATVVLLRTGEEAGGHEPFVPEPGEPVRDIADLLEPRRNLALQTAIVRGARVLVSTYGGFSYLGTYVGTPTVALYSHARFEVAHFDAIDRVGQGLAEGRTRLFRGRHVRALPAGSAADADADADADAA
jgi:hypothetical protein